MNTLESDDNGNDEAGMGNLNLKGVKENKS